MSDIILYKSMLLDHVRKGFLVPTVRLVEQAFERLPNPLNHPTDHYRVMVELQEDYTLTQSEKDLIIYNKIPIFDQYKRQAAGYIEFVKFNVNEIPTWICVSPVRQ